jgi:hypothetical protein
MVRPEMGATPLEVQRQILEASITEIDSAAEVVGKPERQGLSRESDAADAS